MQEMPERPTESPNETRTAGACPESYHQERLGRAAPRYRLRRRAQEIIRAAERHLPRPPGLVVDVGTADGLMVPHLAAAWPSARFIGIELSRDLLRHAPDAVPALWLQADALAMPLAPRRADLMVAAAVIEHVPRPEAFLAEAARILAPGGLLVLTTPHPFWERLATALGHLARDQHHETMTLEDLARRCRGAGLVPVEQYRFMLSPIGMPLERHAEGILRRLGLDSLLANQLLAAKAPPA